MSPLPDSPPDKPGAIRGLSPLDAELLAEIHARSFSPHERWDTPSLSATLALPTTRGWLAYSHDRPEGFILLQMVPPECEILTFCVLPDCRRRKIGQTLLTHAMAQAWESGCAQVFLDVAEDNQAALSLYAHAGFREAGRREGYYAQNDKAAKNALILSLSLASSSL